MFRVVYAIKEASTVRIEEERFTGTLEEIEARVRAREGTPPDFLLAQVLSPEGLVYKTVA